MTRKRKPKTYRIATLTDIDAIPTSKLDAFLIDLGNVLKSQRAMGRLLKNRQPLEWMEWIDDGEHNLQIRIEEAGK